MPSLEQMNKEYTLYGDCVCVLLRRLRQLKERWRTEQTNAANLRAQSADLRGKVLKFIYIQRIDKIRYILTIFKIKEWIRRFPLSWRSFQITIKDKIYVDM